MRKYKFVEKLFNKIGILHLPITLRRWPDADFRGRPVYCTNLGHLSLGILLKAFKLMIVTPEPQSKRALVSMPCILQFMEKSVVASTILT